MKILSSILLFFLVLPIYGQYQLDSVVHIQNDRVTKVSQKEDPQSGIWLKNYILLDPKTNSLLDGTRQCIAFDSNNNQVLNIFSQWDLEAMLWEQIEKSEWEFDENNRLVLSRESVYAQNGWQVQACDTILYKHDSVVTTVYIHSEPSSRNVRYLTREGKDYLSTNYQWNARKKTWDPWMKSIWEYKQDTILEEMATYQWRDGKWMPNDKTTYLFKKCEANPTGSIAFTGGETGWKPLSKTSGANFPEQRLRIDTLYRWSSESNSWAPDVVYCAYVDEHSNKETHYLALKVLTGTTEVLHERTNTYNDNGKVTFHQEVYFENNKAVRGYQQRYGLDEDDNVLQCTAWELDVFQDKWIEKTRTDFTYRPDIFLSAEGRSAVIDPFQLGVYNVDGNKNAVSEAKIYRFENGCRKLHEKVIFYYSAVDSKR